MGNVVQFPRPRPKKEGVYWETVESCVTKQGGTGLRLLLEQGENGQLWGLFGKDCFGGYTRPLRRGEELAGGLRVVGGKPPQRSLKNGSVFIEKRGSDIGAREIRTEAIDARWMQVKTTAADA